jgi:hypothetical protein
MLVSSIFNMVFLIDGIKWPQKAHPPVRRCPLLFLYWAGVSFMIEIVVICIRDQKVLTRLPHNLDVILVIPDGKYLSSPTTPSFSSDAVRVVMTS